jgi:hypothetical protein
MRVDLSDEEQDRMLEQLRHEIEHYTGFRSSIQLGFYRTYPEDQCRLWVAGHSAFDMGLRRTYECVSEARLDEQQRDKIDRAINRFFRYRKDADEEERRLVTEATLARFDGWEP